MCNQLLTFGRFPSLKFSQDPKTTTIMAADDSDAETVVLDNAPTQIKVTKRLKRRPSLDHDRSATAKRRMNDGSKLFTKRDINGRLKLQRMAYKGRYEDVKALIQLGANVNDRDYAGNVALHDAALKGHERIVELLIDNGGIVDIRSGNEDLDTPLINAVANGHLDTVKVLLAHGADPRIHNVQGQTPLDMLDDTTRDHVPIRRLLERSLKSLREKRDARYSSPDLMDPSIHPQGTFPSPQKHNGAAMAKRGSRNDLLSMDLTSRAGREQVLRKAAEGDLEFVGQSLENGWTPDSECLCIAAKHGHTDVTGLLLAYGADVDGTNEEGETPLLMCIGRGHPETVKLLVEAGASVGVKNEQGKTCLDLARSEKEVKLIEGAMKKKRKLVQRDDDDSGDANTKVKVEGQKEKESKNKPEKARPKLKVSVGNDKTGWKLHDAERPLVKKERSPEEDKTKKKSEHRPNNTESSSSKIENKKQSSKESTPDRESTRSKQSTPEKPRQKSSDTDLDSRRESEKQRNLAAKREKVRKERERAMLLQLEQEEQRKASKKQKELELAAQMLQEQEQARQVLKAQDMALEQEKRRLLQVEAKKNQPWGLRMANYGSRTLQDAAEYLPLLARKFKGGAAMNVSGCFVLDIQVALLLGVENIYKTYPELSKRLVTDQEKSRLWTLLIPYLCPQVPTFEDTQNETVLQDRSANRKLFMGLSVFWLRIEQVEEILRRDYPAIHRLYDQKGLLSIDLDYEAQSQNRIAADAPKAEKREPTVLAESQGCNMPVKLRVKLLTKAVPTFW